TYNPEDPFQDNHSHNLADVAMYYWKRDLRPDLENRVPTSARNEAFWQHMVTYGVGLGVQGTIDPEQAFAALRQYQEYERKKDDPNFTVEPPGPISWPDPLWNYLNCGDSPGGAACGARIDDLLHAAVNSRGGFFSVDNAEDFAEELAKVLEDIVGRVEESATSAAASSAVLQEDTLLYNTGFRSGDWSGSLEARYIQEDGTPAKDPFWDAEEQLRAPGRPATRNIIATNGSGSAFEFLFDNLSPDQKKALNHSPDGTEDDLGAQRVAWLRGDENAHDGFRSRSASGNARLLGDIVNSNPQFVGERYEGFARLLGAPSYRERDRIIYLGANDGMLHAFNADNGEEVFAFIPGELLNPEPGNPFAPLSRLMDPDYSHRYFVDGTPVIEEAQIGGQWRTVLIGTMGAGGRTVFALDVTDPSNFDAGKVLWEFTDDDLGYNVGKPQVTRLADGTWAAIFGNGYNSQSHKAMLFVVNLANGNIIRKIDTGEGSGGSPNGLAAPRWTDWPAQDVKASYVYAGDLQGNLWRFDVTDTSPDGWSADKLFTAKDAGDAPQPITSAPAIAVAENGEDLIIAFGTGSYFRQEDGGSLGNQVQSLYGIMDTGSTVSGRNQLRQQIIEEQTGHTVGGQSYTLRKLSAFDLASNHRGWYIDLNMVSGERVINGPTLPRTVEQTRIRFTTMIPDDDPCGTGRRGFLMDIDLFSGGRYVEPVFVDEDGNDLFDEHAWMPSGVEFGTGENPTTIIDGRTELVYSGDPEEKPLRGPADDLPGRQSWQQLR
ncbi:type 4 fimbrial biogenesis protein PilY1, partial [Ectothiorhodospira sp. PHS-1]|uniref:pilus assembly protein n=1 Tax=Ectothiorhodospira sp. PHS-1 TaxID=519989 RepID=UPI00024A80B9